MGPAPDCPATRWSQNSSVLFPSGETTPVPVTSTRLPLPLDMMLMLPDPGDRDPRSLAFHLLRASTRISAGRCLLRGGVRLQIVHRVADGLELVRVLVGNVDAEFLFE